MSDVRLKQTARNSVRVTLRLDEDLVDRLNYWADKSNCSRNEYIAEALYRQIAWENDDYDIPHAVDRRMAQLVDAVSVLSRNVKSLEDITTTGFDSLINLTRGDNYLLEEDENGGRI